MALAAMVIPRDSLVAEPAGDWMDSPRFRKVASRVERVRLQADETAVTPGRHGINESALRKGAG